MDSEILDFYKRHVEEALLPFWKRALDKQYGGLYTCFNNSGTELINTDKYTWSQGRFLWLWSKIARMISENKLAGQKKVYLSQLSKTADFLEGNVFLANGNCAFLLTEDGRKKESIAGKGYDTSLYADCFVVLGFAKYAGLIQDMRRFEIALELYHRIRDRIKTETFRTEPYPIPDGYRAHLIPMIMLNVSQELAEAGHSLNHHSKQTLDSHSIAYMKEIMDHFYSEEETRIVEMMPEHPSSEEDTLLYRHLNPGHTIESMWFVLHAARKIDAHHYIRRAVEIIDKAVDLGWDPRYGGLLRFVDKKGGKPKGNRLSTSYEQLIVDSWDMKLWWPHSEALYATLLSYELTGQEKLLEQYQKVKKYVFKTFPNPNKEVGEWIQIRDRAGNPVDKIAALPVKDPFHILRNMLLIIDLLESKGVAQH